MNLSKNTKISSAITPTDGVAGITDINGTVLDMLGFDAVLMLVRFGAITGTAVTSIKAQQGDLADGSDMDDLAGTGQTIADDADDKTFFIDLARPLKRYVRLVVDRGTANAVVSDAVYVQYGEARKVPTTHGSNVAGELHLSPAEGTA